MTKRECLVSNCKSKHYASDLCQRHYTQQRRHGKVIRTKHDPNEYIDFKNGTTGIVLYNLKGRPVGWTIIDTNIRHRLIKYKWHLDKAGYVVSTAGYQYKRLHHLVVQLIPDGKEIDHINRNPLDNTRNNLRLATSSQNKMNQKRSSRNTSGVKGVSYFTSLRKGKACVSIDNKTIVLGYFKKKEEAVRVRKAAEIKYYKDFAPRS